MIAASKAPDLEPTGACRSCNAPIAWARMPSGKMMPVDPALDPQGLLALDRIADDGTPIIVAVSTKLPREQRRYTSHFARCPHAATHRRKSGDA